MRLVLTNHTPLGGSGSGIHCRMLADTWQEWGHETVVLTPESSAAPHTSFEQASIGTPERPGRWTLPFAFPSFSGHRESAKLYRDLTDDDIGRYVGVWTRALTDVCAEVDADLVHVNHAFLLGHCASEVGLPYGILAHGSEFARDPGDRFGHYIREGILGASALIATAPKVADRLLHAAPVPERRVSVISPGFDPAVFRPMNVDRESILAPFGLDGHRWCVGYVGRMVPYKRPHDVLSALARIPPGERPDAIFVGDGPLLADLKAQALELGLERVAFAGHIEDPSAIARVFNAIDLLLLTSEEDPYPMSAVEALACGTPVLTSDACGVTDVVADVAGSIYPVGDVDAIAEAIVRARGEDWRETRGGEGPARVRDKTWESIAARILELYAGALDTTAVHAHRAARAT
jgi:glycosyltransferase involved in cell wall biosynthesis